jgi:hypothetical protein
MTPNPPPALSRIFLSFFRLGLAAFGGPSMIAYIRRMAHLGLFAATFAALFLKVDILWVVLGGAVIALLL